MSHQRPCIARPALAGRLARPTLAPIIAALLSIALACRPLPASAHSEASLLSASVPLAVSVAAPAAYFVVSGAVFTVLAVEATALGTVWLLARASDGLRASVTIAGRSTLAAGAALSAVAISSGWVLVEAGSALSAAVCFIPNEIGNSLLYNEQLTR